MTHLLEQTLVALLPDVAPNPSSRILRVRRAKAERDDQKRAAHA